VLHGALVAYEVYVDAATFSTMSRTTSHRLNKCLARSTSLLRRKTLNFRTLPFEIVVALQRADGWLSRSNFYVRARGVKKAAGPSKADPVVHKLHAVLRFALKTCSFYDVLNLTSNEDA
jgi:hypothetical protein